MVQKGPIKINSMFFLDFSEKTDNNRCLCPVCTRGGVYLPSTTNPEAKEPVIVLQSDATVCAR